MIFIRKTEKIRSGKLDEFNRIFHTHEYREYVKNGAKLIGRWVNDKEDEILTIWEYKSKEHYDNFEIVKDTSKEIQEATGLTGDISYELLSSTEPYPSAYHPPKHIMSVSGYITNKKGKVLLVRNFHRSDTMEMPGGQVEEVETLEEAIHREILEETGVKVSIIGITGIYQNVTSGVTCIVFRGEHLSGEVRAAENETSEVIFAELTLENIDHYITRPQFKSRALDAMEANYLPYEAFRARPYELISRFDVKKEYS
ncbi:NUDIX hydrolase [Bacillus sp. ISL-35]|uniref:NUDIX hydrolase n=1 Tax=Bacillus sp. ISL-35 TaxID=2819122 RepID=UPI001BEB69AF|nr:NUDIX hydrolase [Bacillus sp. ISL-35]MBT2681200.1 NUDIX hydrolase [Bacillus sp. ISL-35]MBT2706111.1 NUDIX hydrolase [Chryseobacterium sp. ISL-80]